MKFKTLLSLLCFSSVANAAHVQDRTIYATGIVSANGKTPVFNFPTTLGNIGGPLFLNANQEPITDVNNLFYDSSLHFLE